MTTIHTIGHGNRTAEEFVGLLQRAGIRHLVDVRAFPASRRHPHFARAALERTLGDARIVYSWEGEALGGRRRPQPGSANTALRNPSFRAYADHMMGPAFQSALERLIASAEKTHTAIMCAERLPWQCHRFLIADSLVARGAAVLHIVTADEPMAHKLNALARIEGNVPVYDIGVQPDLVQQAESRTGKRRSGNRAD
jgi:uncharacterized protein (DUF488 family)